jgi:hypothetical protein
MVGDLVLPYLMEENRKKGTKFVKNTINVKEDLLKFKENIIFNCMGLGS